MNCPTVKVKTDNEQGFIIINESDFEEDLHELYVDKAQEPNEGTKDWYKSKLDEMNIEYGDNSSKAELVGQYDLAVETAKEEV